MAVLAFFKPGFWELVVVLAIVLVLFGAAKLPKIGASLGEAIRGFRSSVKDEESKP